MIPYLKIPLAATFVVEELPSGKGMIYTNLLQYFVLFCNFHAYSEFYVCVCVCVYLLELYLSILVFEQL